MEFYVGTSRAKYRLDLVTRLYSNDYKGVIERLQPKAPIRNNDTVMRKILGSTFAADIEVH